MTFVFTTIVFLTNIIATKFKLIFKWNLFSRSSQIYIETFTHSLEARAGT